MGAVEFIAGAPLRADRIWFMEMNTRLQVEHPVTEMVTGLDLVEWQVRIARGEALPLAQDDIRLDGVAVEARICAEDPARQFLPSPGHLVAFSLPAEAPGLRVDRAVRAGDIVTPYQEPLLANIIAHAPTRALALQRLADALDSFQAGGVRLNASFLAASLRSEEMQQARVDTNFLEAARQRLVEAALKEPA